MKRTIRVLSATALLGFALGAAPAAADPAYPPTGPGGGGGGGGVLVPPVVQHPSGGGGGGQVVVPPASVNLPHTGADIERQALLGTGVGALGALLIVVAAARRRPKTALA